ncbi:hypothetical protein GCM10014715_52350 [Streptomyces spiralis]|uniref:Uncharacterized protein n=1 Tax=Streptomyces spiralis TaxID=66376 RepID=A0A919A5V2_9ACTN|nr:hypothetical protein GCM10014715_52350 [Streptomyces spiralis]
MIRRTEAAGAEGTSAAAVREKPGGERGTGRAGFGRGGERQGDDRDIIAVVTRGGGGSRA